MKEKTKKPSLFSSCCGCHGDILILIGWIYISIPGVVCLKEDLFSGGPISENFSSYDHAVRGCCERRYLRE